MATALKSIILKFIFIDLHLFNSDRTNKSQNQAKYVFWAETTKNKSTSQSMLGGNLPTWHLAALWETYLLVVFVFRIDRCWDIEPDKHIPAPFGCCVPLKSDGSGHGIC